jgi:hypothetical protein
MILGGVWASAIAVFLVIDTPKFDFAGVEADYDVAYGVFIALGGSVATIVAGVRRRARELIARHAQERKDEAAAKA